MKSKSILQIGVQWFCRYIANHNHSHNRYCKPVFMTSTHAIFGPPAGKKDHMTLAINADPDQTAQMRRLIWDCVDRKLSLDISGIMLLTIQLPVSLITIGKMITDSNPTMWVCPCLKVPFHSWGPIYERHAIGPLGYRQVVREDSLPLWKYNRPNYVCKSRKVKGQAARSAWIHYTYYKPRYLANWAIRCRTKGAIGCCGKQTMHL